MQAIIDTLAFLSEVEQLKNIQRKTRPVGLQRYENSAEHSWHACLAAWMLQKYANEPVDIDRVIKMLLIHDLGEIDAGDVIVYESGGETRQQEEEQGLKRLFDLLPGNQGMAYMTLWYEFEAGETAESRYARAIDRVLPLSQNLQDDGHSWKKHQITEAQVRAVNSRIALGSTALWKVMESRLEQAALNGLFQESS